MMSIEEFNNREDFIKKLASGYQNQVRTKFIHLIQPAVDSREVLSVEDCKKIVERPVISTGNTAKAVDAPVSVARVGEISKVAGKELLRLVAFAALAVIGIAGIGAAGVGLGFILLGGGPILVGGGLLFGGVAACIGAGTSAINVHGIKNDLSAAPTVIRHPESVDVTNQAGITETESPIDRLLEQATHANVSTKELKDIMKNDLKASFEKNHGKGENLEHESIKKALKDGLNPAVLTGPIFSIRSLIVDKHSLSSLLW